MPRSRDDDLGWGPEREPRATRAPRPSGVGALLTNRTLVLAAGFVLAVAATLAVFLTDNRQYLRVAVVAVAWAFVLATVAAGRRNADGATAAVREAQLRHAYELELEREVAARREYELALEQDLRREAEDAMRDELDALRDEMASLGRLRDEVARVSDLRRDLAGLAALRDDVAALNSLRHDLGQLAELRADLGRLRAELSEQLSSEMLVERITMRTQAGRLEPPARPVDVPGRWSDDAPPRELTGGWPAIRLDDPREIRSAEPVRADRPLPAPPTAAMWSAPPSTTAFDRPVPPPQPEPSRPSWEEADDRSAPAPTSPSWLPPAPPSETPLEWLTARSLLDPEPRPAPPPPVPPVQVPQAPATEARPEYRPSPHPRPRPTPPPPSVRLQQDLAPVRRRTDDPDAAAGTAERPAVAGGYRPPTGGGAEHGGTGSADEGDGRLAEILAENGVSPATGSRRRRRYREDGEPDDVLARVLGLR